MTQLSRHSAGFTILELMITVAILAILLGVGVPAFNDTIRNNRVATQTNDLVGALNLARSEATRRGMPVTICAATADPGEPACAVGATDWGNGWLVFTDRMGAVGEYDAGADELVQAAAAVRQGFSITTDEDSFVRFGPGSTPATDATFSVRPVSQTDCVKSGRREITVALTGRVTSIKALCT